MEIKKSNYCAYQTDYHVVFPVKCRESILLPEAEREIVKTKKRIRKRCEIKFEELGCNKNHIYTMRISSEIMTNLT